MNLRQLLDQICEEENIPLEDLLEKDFQLYDATSGVDLTILNIEVGYDGICFEVGDES